MESIVDLKTSEKFVSEVKRK